MVVVGEGKGDAVGVRRPEGVTDAQREGDAVAQPEGVPDGERTAEGDGEPEALGDALSQPLALALP